MWRTSWYAAGMRDLFSQLPGGAESCKVPLFPGDCPSRRKQPCSRLCPLPRGTLHPVLAQRHSDSPEDPPRLQGALRGHWGLSWVCITTQLLLFPPVAYVTSLSQGWVPRILYPPSPGMLIFTPGSVFFSYETCGTLPDNWFAPSELEVLFRKWESS